MSDHHQTLGIFPSREFMRDERWVGHRFAAIFCAICLGIGASEWMISLAIPRTIRYVMSSALSAVVCLVALGTIERITRRKP
jgi:hypothetical protein